MEVRHRVVGSQSEWTEALSEGQAKGSEEGAKLIRDAAEASLAARRTPWGEAFAPLSTATVRLSAKEEEVGYMRTGADGVERFVDTSVTRKGKVGIEKRDTQAFGPLPRGVQRLAPNSVVRVRGSRQTQRIAYIHQFGNPNNRMFENTNPAPIPARPILPLKRDGAGGNIRTELTAEMSRAILVCIQTGITQAFERTARAQNPGQRRR
jgi:hypothetical protein